MIDVSPLEIQVIRDILSENLPGCRVAAFGSRVNKRAKQFSDLDLVIISENPVSTYDMAILREAFSESDLTFRVDLLQWNQISDSFREKISQNLEFIQ